MSNVKWVIDDYIFNRDEQQTNTFEASFKKLGIDYHLAKYIPFSDEQDYGPKEWRNDPVVLYGTWNYIKKCKIPFTPGAYGATENMNCNFYYHQIPKDWLLNGDYFILPFGEILRNKDRIVDNFGHNFFLRPVSGGKTFAGFPCHINDLEQELSSSMQLSSVSNETMVMIAKAIELEAEYRFIIGDGKVIDGSQYRRNDILDIRRDWSGFAFDVANDMAKHSWQPDLIYTCDVAEVKGEVDPKIIELNSFSCAGLYACDKVKVIQEVSEIALQEFKGLI